MRDYDFTRRAVRDIASSRDWYADRDTDLGNQFFNAVLEAIREVREHPERYPEIEPGVRGVGCFGFPYRIYYEPRPTKIIVRAVYHMARNPKRWDDKDRD